LCIPRSWLGSDAAQAHPASWLDRAGSVWNVLAPLGAAPQGRSRPGTQPCYDGRVHGRYRIRVDEELGDLELVEAVHDRPRFARHAHATYALGVVQRGVNRFRYRGAFHVAAAGRVCTVTPDEAHEIEPVAGAGFAYRCLYPGLDVVQEVAASVAGRRVAGTLALPPVIEDPEVARGILALFDAEAAGAPPLAREAQLLALLARVAVRHALHPVAPRAKAPPAPALARARDYLAACHAENVGLAQLAAIAGVDRFALVRGFSRAYGLPPHAWLLQERVRRAQALLRAGRPIAEVAAEVGFADQSHLTRRFRQVVGVTPGRYRAAASRGA
jgi:AraC-like DNA-binding protein